MSSKYKVGDRVTVKNKYDPGRSSSDYPESFTPAMLQAFGGKVYEIISVTPSESSKAYNLGDPYVYRLKGDSRPYIWHSSMFEANIKKSSIHLSKRRKVNINIKLN